MEVFLMGVWGGVDKGMDLGIIGVGGGKNYEQSRDKI